MELYDPLAAWYALCNSKHGELAKGWKVEAVDIQIERCVKFFLQAFLVVLDAGTNVHISLLLL